MKKVYENFQYGLEMCGRISLIPDLYMGGEGALAFNENNYYDPLLCL